MSCSRMCGRPHRGGSRLNGCRITSGWTGRTSASPTVRSPSWRTATRRRTTTGGDLRRTAAARSSRVAQPRRPSTYGYNTCCSGSLQSSLRTKTNQPTPLHGKLKHTGERTAASSPTGMKSPRSLTRSRSDMWSGCTTAAATSQSPARYGMVIHTPDGPDLVGVAVFAGPP